MQQEDIEQAVAHAQGAWMDEDGVVAVGQGEEGGRPTIDVWVSGPTTASFPDELEGFKVRVRDSGGEIFAGG